MVTCPKRPIFWIRESSFSFLFEKGITPGPRPLHHTMHTAKTGESSSGMYMLNCSNTIIVQRYDKVQKNTNVSVPLICFKESIISTFPCRPNCPSNFQVLLENYASLLRGSYSALHAIFFKWSTGKRFPISQKKKEKKR